MLSKISWPTAAVVIAGIAALIACAALKLDVDWIVGVATAFIGLAAAMQKLLKDDDDPKPPSPPALPVLAMLAVLVGPVMACTPVRERAIKEYLADKADCAVRNMNLPNEEIVKRCAVDANDAEQIFHILAGARQEAAKEATEAAERARDETIRAAVAGAIGACR